MSIINKLCMFKKSVLLLAAFLGLFGCSQGDDDGAHEGSGAEAKSTVSWGGPKNIAMLPIIAQKEGFFAERQLDTSSSYLQTGKITLDSVIRGEIDFGIIVEATVAFAAFQPDLGIKIIAINQEKLDDAIVARRDSNITTARDIVGKRLGVTRGTNSQMYAFKFMEANNINPADVSITNLSPPAIVAALNNGDIDAGSVWQPYRHNLNKQLGDNAVNFTNNGIYRGYAIVVVNEEFMNNNPAIVSNFLLALKGAENHIKENKAKSIKIIAKEIDMDADLLGSLWHEYSVELNMTPDLVSAMQDEGRWIISNVDGFENKKLPDYRSLVDEKLFQKLFE